MNFGPEVTVADWILDVACAPEAFLSHFEAALVTAHNGLSLLKVTDAVDQHPARSNRLKYGTNPCNNFVPSISQSQRLHCGSSSPCDSISLSLNEVIPSSRCILYSAHLRWLSRDRALVASGTSFGDIIVWSCFLGDPSSRTEVHHTLTGHDGSVFGVHISRELSLPGDSSPRRLLASCSDDRTIRTWDITDLSRSASSNVSGVSGDLLQTQETGFRSSNSITNDASSDSRCLAVAWGHASRIWKVRFVHHETLDDHKAPLAKLVSVGEDATCQSWDLLHSQASVKRMELQGKPLFLQHVGTSAYHSGKNIWSYDVSESVDGWCDVVTGAADGKIVSQKLPLGGPNGSQEGFWQSELSTEQTSLACSASSMVASMSSSKSSQGSVLRVAKGSEDDFRCYAFVGEGAFVATTRSGNVLLAEYTPKDYSRSAAGLLTWRSLARLDDLRGYSVAAGVAAEGVAFFAGSSGTIHCYSRITGKMLTLSSVEGKVAGLFVQRVNRDHPQALLNLVVTRLGGKAPHQLLIDVSAVSQPVLVRNLELHVEQGLPPSFVVTSALHSLEVDGIQEELLLGSRTGSIAVLRISGPCPAGSDTDSQSAARVSLAQILHGVHGKEAVTAMHWLSSTGNTTDRSGWLVSVGRDGMCDVRRRNLHQCSWTVVHRLTLPFGPNIEGIHVGTSSGALLVHGFRKKEFVLYDALAEEEIMSIDCGGAHRDWAFYPLDIALTKDHCGRTFVWTQASSLHAHTESGSSHRVIRSGGHGREIKACAVSLWPLDGNIAGNLIATGAEDTNIRIFAYNTTASNAASRGFRCLAVIRKHNTGIQGLQWSNDGAFLFSSGGFEEFFVWRVRSVPVVGVGVVCESACPIENEAPDLRIMSFDVRQLESSDYETVVDRIREFVISMVYSDSSIKVSSTAGMFGLRFSQSQVFRYSSLSSVGQWTLLQTGNYLSSCLTQVVFLGQDGHLTQLTAGTDGHVALWPRVLTEPTAHANAARNGSDESIEWQSRSGIHQSTIKTLTTATLADDATLLLTGGDDNALAFTLIRSPTGNANMARRSAPTTSTLLVPRAHVTAITASAILAPAPHPDDDERGIRRLRAITSSTDQHVKAWDIEVDLNQPGVEGLGVSRSADVFSPVADVSSMALLSLHNGIGEAGVGVLVCGVGMDLWRMASGGS